MQKIATALLKAKQAFGPALKVKTNPAFKSKYADLSACLDAVDQPCLDSGIVLYQETSEDATGVTVETIFLHESGESLRCGKLHVPAAKQDPQGYGSALSYARRYSLMAACGIAPEDDDGNAAAKALERREPDVPAILRGITGSATVEILKANFEAAMSMLDAKHHETIKTAKNARYKQLTAQKEPA
jgi:hypothetical protein